MIKKIKLYFYSFLLKLILNSIFFTCKWKIINVNEFEQAIKNNRPIMLCFWHESLVCVSRYFKKTPYNLFGVSSNHFDSEVLARILHSWNIRLIRGSSSRGWVSVIKQMFSKFQDSSTIIALTNDGPKGPPKIAKEGSLSVAKKCKAQILAVSSLHNSFWKLKTWDQTIIPKPFSTIYIKFSNIYSSEISSDAVTNFINKNSEEHCVD